MEAQHVPQYDFFIAYASPDRKSAQQLCWFLQDERCEVFLDTQMALGTAWPTELRTALDTSRAIVVLVSSHTATAWYEQEEIASAIRRARREPQGCTVIPVHLEEAGQGTGEMPYGTGVLQALQAGRAGGLKRVAADLVAWLEAQVSSAALATPLSAANYQALGAALRLDRYPQWSGVLEACGRPGHLLLLLHGPRQQNVGLFVQRIERYLSSETRAPHLVCRVRFSMEGATPRNGTDWLRHVRVALTDGSNARGSLARAAQQQPLFLILGLRPLDRLEATQQQGLQEFLEVALPELLRQERPAHDVRVLLALDYDAPDASAGLPALVQQAQSWGRTAQASGQLQYLPLPPVTLPTWQDVEHYIVSQPAPPPPDTLAALQAEYQRLTSGRASSYQELADLIDRYLQDA